MLWEHYIFLHLVYNTFCVKGFERQQLSKPDYICNVESKNPFFWLTVHFLILFLIQFNFWMILWKKADIYMSVTMHLLWLKSQATLLLFSYSSLLKWWFVTPVPNSCSYRLSCDGLQKHAWLPKLGNMVILPNRWYILSSPKYKQPPDAGMLSIIFIPLWIINCIQSYDTGTQLSHNKNWGVFPISLKLHTLQQLLLMFCSSTKISELHLELQNSLMLNPQVGEECRLVLIAI